MEFVEVSDVLVCTSGNKIVFWMDGDSRVIAFVGEERRYSGCCIRSIVVSKLGQWEEQTPVIVTTSTDSVFTDVISSSHWTSFEFVCLIGL